MPDSTDGGRYTYKQGTWEAYTGILPTLGGIQGGWDVPYLSYFTLLEGWDGPYPSYFTLLGGQNGPYSFLFHPSGRLEWAIFPSFSPIWEARMGYIPSFLIHLGG